MSDPTKLAEITIENLLAEARKKLAPGSESPGLDAQTLLAHVLGQPRSWLLAHGEVVPGAAEAAEYERGLARLEAGAPLPYVLGEWEFYGQSFLVNPHVLIPRPETELLVERALAWLQANPARRRALDVGTGSGCIAVSIAINCADLNIYAIDNSGEALAVCEQNAQRLGVAEQVEITRCDLLESVSGKVDLICANLPYIPGGRLPQLAVYGREPSVALDGGADGLDLIQRMLAQAPAHINPGGLLLLEIDASQEESAADLARQYFPDAAIAVEPDLAGLPRLLVIEVAV